MHGEPASDSARVLIVVTNADLAGAPSHVRDLVNGLRQRYEISVAFGEDGPIKALFSSQGIDVHLLPGLASRISPLADIRATKALTKLVRQLKPDLIHAHSSKAGLIARLAGLISRVPVVFTVHGWGFGIGRPKRQSQFVWLSERLMAPFARRYITVSQTDANVATQRLGLSPKKVEVIHNGVPDTLQVADPKLNRGIIMVARVDASKDYETALRAYSRVATDMQFTCIGHGTDSEEFSTYARSWATPAQDRLSLKGPSTQIAGELATSAIFVLASRWEGLPLSIIEAMRAGLPIVATDAGGVDELVDSGKNGYVVPIGAPAALRDALQTLVDDPELRSQFGAESRRRYKAMFQVEQMCEKVSGVYDQILLSR